MPLTILGGFTGNEVGSAQRDPEVNPTILSGQDTQRVLTLNGADVTLDGFTITRGFAPGYPWGGGLYAASSTLKVANCRWTDNGVGGLGATTTGGGAVQTYHTDVTIEDSVFDGNASGGGSAVAAHLGPMALRRCDFTNNTADFSGGAVWVDTSWSAALVEDCAFGGNRAGVGGGAVVVDHADYAVIRDCLFISNSAGPQEVSIGGALRAWSARVENSAFIGNAAVGLPTEWGRAAGGAAFVENDATFVNCFFSGNRADGAGHHAGGGAIAANGPTTMLNTTLIFNGANAEWDARSEGGGVWVDSSGATPGSLAASNCILWNNWATRVGTTEATQIAAAPADVVIDHSMVTGWTGVFGEEGNTGEEPRLVSPGGLDGMIGTIDDDPRLDAFSPCVDAGRNSALPTGITTDVLGHPRFVDDPAVPDTGSGPGPVSDMGAAERQVASCYADCNSDGVLDLSDFGCFQTRFAVGDPAADCNGDGVLGLADFGCFQTKFALGCP